MRKILNISLLLLVLGLSGSFSCQRRPSSWQTGLEEPDFVERLFRDENLFRDEDRVKDEELVRDEDLVRDEELLEDKDYRFPTAAPVEAAPALVGPELAAMSQVTPHVVSRTYPCAECGIILLDKTMPKEVELNQLFDYSIKVTNLTSMTLTDVVIVENLPDNFNFTSANPTAQKNANYLKWEIHSLEPRGSRQITISGIPTDTGRLKHYTTAVTNSVPACTSVEVVQPKLELMMTAPATALLCAPIPVQFVVGNSGTGSIQDVKIVSTLPAGLRTIDDMSQIVFDAGTLTAGRSRQLLANLRAAESGRYVCRAVASSADGLKTSSAAGTVIVGQPVLTVEMTGAEHWYLDRLATHEITVANKGELPAKNTVIEDVIPGGVASIEATAEGKLSGSTVVWQLGTLAPGASKSVSLSYIPTTEGQLTNIATATADCAEAVTASTKTSIRGIPGVLLEVIDIEDPVIIGNLVTYVIAVTNQGSAHGTNIRIACVLEDNVQYVSSAGTSPGSIKGNTVRFAPLASLAPKAKATWRVMATAVKPGDVRCRVTMDTDQLTRPVEETEATHLYE